MTSMAEATSAKKDGRPEVSSDQYNSDLEEKQIHQEPTQSKKSVYAGLGWLDRLLALWILLAIAIGILLGNFVNGVEEALQRGKFVQVSVPIGKFDMYLQTII